MRVVFASITSLISLAGGCATAAEQPSQFGLTCTGTIFRKMDGKENGQIPYKAQLRVDLPHRVWCLAPCETVQSVVSISENKIVLQESSDADIETYMTVNRRTGELAQAVSFHPQGGNGRTMDVTIFADCKPTNFTAIPEKLF